jgi:hypothetical protein
MLLELRRTGGFTGTSRRWRVDTGDDPSWRALVEAVDLAPYRGVGPVLKRAALGWVAGGHHDDHQYELRVDGRRARFRGVHVEGALSDLVDRIVTEGDENGSRGAATTG